MSASLFFSSSRSHTPRCVDLLPRRWQSSSVVEYLTSLRDHQAVTMSKPSFSTSRTVFVRFIPPSANIRRHHLEDLFSQIGPIKKSSVIVPRRRDNEESGTEASASSYGFVKYVAEDEAQKAAEKLDRSMLRISAEEELQLRVERASDVANNKRKKTHSGSQDGEETHHNDTTNRKKTNRIIIRNLSFYAKESHIRKALEGFGPIEDIHLPTVSDKRDTKGKIFHRGFGFVTFRSAKDAQKCLRATNIEIHKRTVQVTRALHKAGYEKLKHSDICGGKGSSDNPTGKSCALASVENDSDGNEEETSGSSDSDGSSVDNEGMSDEDEDNEIGSGSDDHEQLDVDHSDASDEDAESVEQEDGEKDTAAVDEKRSLFLRNLPFDATRHDIFEAFRMYGRISGIFIVKDRQSGLPRGTAFLSYETPGAAHRAMVAAGSDNFTCQRKATEGRGDTLSKDTATTDDKGLIRGRRVFVNLAVDKDTASTLSLDRQADRGKVVGKDRRNLYLKGEGRVDNEGENALWDKLPEQDKLKRQKAWSEKNTKLKSPLFLISATRLSLRNLAKDVDERRLKMLCVTAVQRGMQRGLVTAEDQIAHWRAAGEMTTREIIEKVDGLESRDQVIPDFDDKNIRKFMPSVVVERDFSSNRKDGAPSRGFGFVEFLHHVHALACLRELNNNTTYTEDYVSGGRQAVVQKEKRHKKWTPGEESNLRISRLIVEFAVENRAKAKKQAEHKAQQRANKIKQKIENRENSHAEKKKENKKSRGARQRERKRKQKEDTSDDANENGPPQKAKMGGTGSEPIPSQKAPVALRPPKKRKVDKAEDGLSKFVDSYQQSLVPSRGEAEGKERKHMSFEKRWFEE